MANDTNLQSALSTLDSMDTLDDLSIGDYLDENLEVFEIKDQVEQPDFPLRHGGIHRSDTRSYSTRTCLLCKTHVDADKWSFHRHEETTEHWSATNRLTIQWSEYNYYKYLKEKYQSYAPKKGVYISQRTEIFQHFIKILSSLTRHQPWLIEEAGKLFLNKLVHADTKRDRGEYFKATVNRIYKKEVLALVLLGYVKRKVTFNETLTLHEARVPDSKFGSSKPFSNLLSSLAITSGHIIVNRIAPFITTIA